MRAVALAPDLMDASKLRGAGVEVVRSLDELDDAVEMIIVDLDRAELPDPAVVGGRRLVGFGRHTDPDRLRQARAAGCDEVLARSAFFTRLSSLLGSF